MSASTTPTPAASAPAPRPFAPLQKPFFHPVVARLSLSDLLGRRRVWLMAALPLLLVLLALAVRGLRGPEETASADVLQQVGFGVLLPLLTLIAGTGTIGPLIDDGSVVYLLAKPLSRHTIVRSQVAVAMVVALLFTVIPMVLSGVILEGSLGEVTLALSVGAAACVPAYVAVFYLLAVVSRSAVLIGLLYAVIWEGVVGGYVPGAKSVSIRQWGTSVSESLLGKDKAGLVGVDSPVGIGAAIVLLLVVTLLSVWYAGVRLKVLRLRSAD